jgi:hypothetical protein
MTEYIHIGDILAIPFFFLLAVYFLNKKKKTQFEWLLLGFSISGLFADIWFTFMYAQKQWA